jgi:hypothetical protein
MRLPGASYVTSATRRTPAHEDPDASNRGNKHHVIVEAHGIPLATTLTGGNRNDVTQLIPLIQAVPPIRGKRGQPLRRPRRDPRRHPPSLRHPRLRHHLLATPQKPCDLAHYSITGRL